MIDIETNKEIKNVPSRFWLGLSIPEVMFGIFSVVIGVIIFNILPFPVMAKGYICITVVVLMMFGFLQKIQGLSPAVFLLQIIKYQLYAGKEEVFTSGKEDMHDNGKDDREG